MLLIAAVLLAPLACAEDASAPDPCVGDGAPSLGCACLSGETCPKTTGLRLEVGVEDLAAPADFDALAIQVASDAYPALRRNIDVFAEALVGREGSGQRQPARFPLELLLLAELPRLPAGGDGTAEPAAVELDLMATAYLCRSRAGQTAPLADRTLDDCVTTVQRMTGSSGRAPRTIKLRPEKVKSLALTLKPVPGF